MCAKTASKFPYTTHGGGFGYWFRRLVHVAMGSIPYFYYWHGGAIAGWLWLSPQSLLIVILVGNAAMETLRLQQGWLYFGHRHYERRQICSFAWGITAICLVLLLAPGGFSRGVQYGLPIIWGCALGDPIIGELRRFSLPASLVHVLALIVFFLIWLGCHHWLGTPLWLAFVMSPLTLVAELPSWHWIDDNALMQLSPLLLLWIFKGLGWL